MQLICPHCRINLTVPDTFRRFYNYPFQCQACRRGFSFTRRHHLREPASHALAGVAFERSISAYLTNHIIRCPTCRSQMRIPGQEPADTPVALTCPACRHDFSHHAGRNSVSARGIIMAVIAGGMMGLLILFLDHQGHIAIERLAITSWLHDLVTTLPSWISQIGVLADQLRTEAMARLV